jgi:Spy/CpxP family protein refolding chaperone
MQKTTVSDTNTPPRSTRRKWALGGVIASGTVALAMSLGAWAGGRHGGDFGDGMHWGAHHGGASAMMPFGGRHLSRVLDRIDATPAQREQIKPLAEKAMADTTRWCST